MWEMYIIEQIKMESKKIKWTNTNDSEKVDL